MILKYEQLRVMIAVSEKYRDVDVECLDKEEMLKDLQRIDGIVDEITTAVGRDTIPDFDELSDVIVDMLCQ